jgi:hypothetical protein
LQCVENCGAAKKITPLLKTPTGNSSIQWMIAENRLKNRGRLLTNLNLRGIVKDNEPEVILCQKTIY